MQLIIVNDIAKVPRADVMFGVIVALSKEAFYDFIFF